MKKTAAITTTLLTALFLCVTVVAGQCPDYAHKDEAPIGAAAGLPDGWFIFYKQGTRGIFKSSLKTYNAAVIPNTNGYYCRSMDISSSGEWIVFAAYNGEWDFLPAATFLIRPDGSNRTEIPAATNNYNGDLQPPPMVGFYRGSPIGDEVYYGIMTCWLYAIQVTLPATGAAWRHRSGIRGLVAVHGAIRRLRRPGVRAVR